MFFVMDGFVNSASLLWVRVCFFMRPVFICCSCSLVKEQKKEGRVVPVVGYYDI